MTELNIFFRALGRQRKCLFCGHFIEVGEPRIVVEVHSAARRRFHVDCARTFGETVRGIKKIFAYSYELPAVNLSEITERQGD